MIALLEGRCAWEAARNASDDDLTALEALHDRLAKHARARRINDYYATNFAIHEAIIESSTLRLRPIIMTSIATAFGALPLVLWQGAGAGSRQTIGVVIFAGAMFATLLTLFVVPVIYGVLARFTKSPEYTARKIEEWEAQEVTANDPVPAAAE